MVMIGYGSDIHWEFGPVVIKNPGVDILVLAGDTNLMKRQGKDKNFDNFIQGLSDSFEDIIIIAGNHEFYHGSWFKTLDKLREYYEGFSNIHFLEDEFVDIRGVRFIGSTLWTSLDNGNPVIMNTATYVMNCYNLIRNDRREYRKIIPEDVIWRYKRSFEFIEKSLVDDCIVVTHTAPSYKSISEEYRYAVYNNFSYFTELDRFILDNPQILAWIHGHTHHKSPIEYLIGSTRVLCNTRGYFGNESIDHEFKLKTFEIRRNYDNH